MTDWYTENRQNKQLESLRDEMARASSETWTLRSQLSQLQGGMESRLSSLAAAFDAFVELSDIRYELIGFADAAEVRRHAGQVLSALASGDEPPAPGRKVAGYWLGPAVEALSGPASDDLAGGPLDEAMALDERRTSTFLCLALAALGRRNQVSSNWLSTAFGALAPDGTVTRVQRALWTAGARGGFGADGLNVVVQRLQVPEAASAERWLAPVEARSDMGAAPAPAFPELVDLVKTRSRLSRLRAAVETITGDTAVLEPDRDLAYGASEEPEPDSTSALLRLLISEGSEPERATLARITELRASITNGNATGGGSIDDPAGTVQKLLESDLRRSDEPHLAATALRVVAAGVMAGAEELARTASLPTPGQVTREIEWQRITLMPDGPEAQSIDWAESAIVGKVEPLSTSDLVGPGTIAAAGTAIAIGLSLLHPFWIVVGLAAVAAGAYQYLKARKRKAAEHADAAARMGRLREKSAEAAAELAAYIATDADRATSIATDLEELRKRLSA
ncbi:MAG TPA: hypothetical protein VGD15_17475 [Kribbella sp.]